jgi:hypothetical protein
MGWVSVAFFGSFALFTGYVSQEMGCLWRKPLLAGHGFVSLKEKNQHSIIFQASNEKCRAKSVF